MTSLYLLAKRLTTDVTRVIARTDVAELEPQQRQLVQRLKGNLADARLDARDYEYAETREQQMRHAHEGRQRLSQARQDILVASGYGLFSAIEVASLSAQIDRIIDGLA